MKHAEKVARIVADVKARAATRASTRGFVSLQKAAVSHFVPNPHDPRHADTKLDVRDLVEILDLDVEGRTCTAEPGLTFSALVRATLPQGLVPKLVPELEAITIGGAVAGCAIESMSYKHGGFHDSCLELELVTGTGEVLRCSRTENRDLFEMLHGSYGTLGVITQLRFELVPAKPFVRMEYQSYQSVEALTEQMLAQCEAPDVDFIDVIAHSRDQLVLCLGRFVESAPHVSAYTGTEIFYESTLRRKEDCLTTYDYLFRYDTDCHWATRALPGMTTRLGRRLFGRWFLGSTRLLGWSRRLRPILKHQKHLPVVIDLLIPKRRFAEFCRWYEREIGYHPLWIVPYRMPVPYRWVSEAHRSDLYVDVAVYGLPNDVPGVNYSKLLEAQTYALGGVKTLISENHYDQDTFWKIYDRAAYADAKRRADPLNLFRDVYRKFHFVNPHARAETAAAKARRGSERPVRVSMRARRWAAAVLAAWSVGGSSAAHARESEAADTGESPTALETSTDSESKKLSLLAGAGSLNSPGASGGALWTGLRLALGRHLAASVDLGYGLVGTAPSAQDRWWLIPALAVVIPAGPLRIDLGAGAGVGTSSGYPAWSSYFGAPFSPSWHDTVPIVRAHTSIAKQLAPNLDVFARAEMASLLFAGPHDGTLDTLWLSLWLGVQIGIL